MSGPQCCKGDFSDGMIRHSEECKRPVNQNDCQPCGGWGCPLCTLKGIGEQADPELDELSRLRARVGAAEKRAGQAERSLEHWWALIQPPADYRTHAPWSDYGIRNAWVGSSARKDFDAAVAEVESLRVKVERLCETCDVLHGVLDEAMAAHIKSRDEIRALKAEVEASVHDAAKVSAEREREACAKVAEDRARDEADERSLGIAVAIQARKRRARRAR